MNIDPFPLFLDLIKFDQETLTLNEKREKLVTSIAQHQKDIDVLNNEITQYKNNVIKAQKEVDTQELHMKQLDTEEKRKKSQLDQSSNAKEYAGLKKEITLLKEQQHENENIVIASWQALENATKLSQEHSQKLAEKVQTLEQEIAHISTSIITIDQELTTRGSLREEKAHKVPRELLEKYVAMRTQTSNPVIPIINSSCSACSHYLTLQELAEVKQKRLMQCKDCFRFLYLPEDPLNKRIVEQTSHDVKS